MPLGGKILPPGLADSTAAADAASAAFASISGGAPHGTPAADAHGLSEGALRLDAAAFADRALDPTGLAQRAALLLDASRRLAQGDLTAGARGLDAGPPVGASAAAAHAAGLGAQAALASVGGPGALGVDGASAAAAQAGAPALAASPSAALDHALAQRLVFMAQHGFRDARLHLHPEHLGAIDVRLTLDHDAAQVTLSSPHALVRDAMAQAVPQLRDLFGSAGLVLAQVNVDAGHAQGSGAFDARAGSESEAGNAGTGGNDGADERQNAVALRLPAGLVDLFA